MKLIDKIQFLSVSFLLFILCTSNHQIKAQSVDAENTVFKNVRTAKVVINQDYEKATAVNLPIQFEISRLLQTININENSERFDMVISIDIIGLPLWGQYLTGSNYEIHYSGAYVKASVTFQLNNKKKITKTFENKTDPPGSINLAYKKPLLSPNDAPFVGTYELPLYKAFYYCTYHSFGIQPIIKALETDEIIKKNAAAEILVDIKDPIAIKPLIQALCSYCDNKSVKKAILAINDTSAVEPLINALQNNDYSVRESAAEALGSIKDTRAVGPLIIAIADHNPSVGKAAIEALGLIEDNRAVEPLIFALNERNTTSAAKALGALKDPRAVDPLIIALKENRDNWICVANIAQALGHIKDPRAVEPLIYELKKSDNQYLAEALGAIKDPRAVEPLLIALKDRNNYLRKEAAIALGTIGDTCAVFPLLSTLQDYNSDVSYASKEALIAINDPRSVEPLIVALNNKRENVRKVVAETLGGLGDFRAVESLNAALRDNDPNVGYAAANAIIAIKMKNPHAVELLIIDLQSDNSLIGRAAYEALKLISGKDLEYNYRLWQKWWKKQQKSTKQ